MRSAATTRHAPTSTATGNIRACDDAPVSRRAMCGARATATLRRSEFGMTAGLPSAAGDEVRIVIPVEAMQE